ncbi:MAG: hypothetical protein ACXU8S_17125 [Phenylobacterium sp.]
MIPKPLAVFTADFPDDQVEDAQEIVLYGGRNVGEALCRIIGGFGGETSGLLYEGVKGWSFEARYEGHAYACLLTSFHPEFFLTFSSPYLGGQLGAANFGEFWQAMDAALRRDERFHELRWFENDDAPDPWESASPPDGPTAAELAAAVRERVRRAKRERRRANWGCLIAVASIVGILIGLMETLQGAVSMLVNSVGRDQVVLGLLILLISGLGLWTLYRWSKTSRDA